MIGNRPMVNSFHAKPSRLLRRFCSTLLVAALATGSTFADDGRTGGGDRVGGSGTGGWANTPSSGGGSGGSSQLWSGIGLVFTGNAGSSGSVLSAVQSSLLYRQASSRVDAFENAVRLQGGFGLQMTRPAGSSGSGSSGNGSSGDGLFLHIGSDFLGGVMVVEGTGLPPVLVPLASSSFDLSFGLLDALADAGVRELTFRFIAPSGRLTVMAFEMFDPLAQVNAGGVVGRAAGSVASRRTLAVTSW